MFTLGTHFNELLKNIRPPDDRIEAAVELPAKVRDYLRTHQDFATCAPHSRLAGSYAQNMSACDVKDVDFLVRIPGDPEACDPAPRKVIRDLANVLEELPDALGYEGGFAEVDVERARRSVHVYLPSEDFHLDAVPCIAPDGFDEPLWVPDRGWNKWVLSHPLGYVRLLNELNKEHGEKVKPLGRLLKHFRNVQMKSRKPKSYWLGVLLVQCVDCEDGLDTRKSLAELFHDLLAAVYEQYDHLLWTSDTVTPNLSDPMLGHNVSWNWSRTHFQTFMARVKDGRDLANQALNAGDRATAIEKWQKVFGEEYFPLDVSAAAKTQAEYGWPNKASVCATGIITRSPAASVLATPILATKFHGSSDG